MNDMISVIVPIYKTEQYLRACIDSITRQTYKNLEIILVNDGSPDNSRMICEEYATKDSRIKVINRPNGGLSAARNSGLEHAMGEYIAFVDSDDIIEPTMYEILIDRIKKCGADICQCGVTSIDILQYNCLSFKAFNISERKMGWKEAMIALLDSEADFTCGVWNKLYTKALFEEIRFTIGVRSEDFIIHYQLLNEKSPNIVCIDIPLYHYIKRNSSITTGHLNESNFNFIDLLHKMEKEEQDSELREHWKIQKAVSARNIMIRQIKSGSFPERFKSLQKDMIEAKFIIGNKKFRNINKSLKIHILLLLLSPRLYKTYIKIKGMYNDD